MANHPAWKPPSEAEYSAYVAECKTAGVEAINYMNWATGKKFAYKASIGERAFDRREKPRSAEDKS